MSFTPSPVEFVIRGRFQGNRVAFPTESVPFIYLSIERALLGEQPKLKKGLGARSDRPCLAECKEVSIDIVRIARVDGIAETDRRRGEDVLSNDPALWSIVDRGSLQQEPSDAGNLRAPKRLLELKFDGRHFSTHDLDCREDARLYRAILEQGKIQFDVTVCDRDHPEDSVTAPLLVKLAVQLR